MESQAEKPKVYAPTPEEIVSILAAHKLWAEGSGGNRADLTGANLRSADLTGANLRSADLRSADLRVADLRSADLRSADLRSADLRSADLRVADLRVADLRGADLRDADLRGANLRDADLRGADLRDADLRGADLRDADLTGEPWGIYLSAVVPALLVAGGASIRELVEAGAWECHSWDNCPMHKAFRIESPLAGPPLLRPRIEQFVQLFDVGLIPAPIQDAAGNWTCLPVTPDASKS